ncbi:MAG: selenocysteine-specific translation elongation factor, partial [Planctomycetota bacterium]
MAEIHRIVLGTAGHIDHGKSTLVEKLTGVNPDRLPEEKERGMTIDLGFAPLVLEDGRRVGIVDVPGHERFIKNMVAGATGIDAVLLVVAADDGVMPQTREHLEIMELLGLRRGMVVVTKVDLAERDLLPLVLEDVRALVAGTFLEGAPLFPVSSTTGEGWPPFREALERFLRETPPRSSEGVFRMPIQRVFSARGHGTVVTGIPVSGRIRLGDRVEILPGPLTGRLRGIQAYRESVEEARAGHSSALNLSDLDYREVRRGMTAAVPGFFKAASMVEAKFRYLPRNRRPLLDRTEVRFHAGTAETIGVAVLLD